MSAIVKKNVVHTFLVDTFIHHEKSKLEKIMREKHGWSKEQFTQYYLIYLDYLAKLDTINITI